MSTSRPVFPRWVPALAGLVAVGWLLWLLRTVLTPVLGGFLIAYILDPLVDRLERWRIPRALGIVIVLAGALALLGLVVLLVLPGVVREFGQFAHELPRHAGSLARRIEPWLADRGIAMPHSVREVVEQLGVDVKDLAGKAAAPASRILAYVAGGTASILGAVAGLLIIPVFAFYLLYDFDRLVAGIRELVPWRLRPFVVDVAQEIDAVLAQFVRGQLLIMLLLAVLYAVAYSLLGVRLAVPIGIVAGLLSFIPYVGGATALGLALLMCALGGSSWAQVGGVVAAYAVIQALEGFVITPRVMEEKVGLSAIWVLLALMVFGELFGFFGVLLAVPAAAVAKIFVVRAIAHYRQSALFLEGEPQGSNGAPGGLARALLVAEGLADGRSTQAAKAVATNERAGQGPSAKTDASPPTPAPPRPERPPVAAERPKAAAEPAKNSHARPDRVKRPDETRKIEPASTGSNRPRPSQPAAGENRRSRKRRQTGRG